MFSRRLITIVFSLVLMAQPFMSQTAQAWNQAWKYNGGKPDSIANTTGLDTSGHSRVLIAIGNSQSMDGNIQGALMTGSGAGAKNPTYLSPFSGGNYSGTGATPVSPDTYTIPAGFGEACATLNWGCNGATAPNVTPSTGTAAYTLSDSKSVEYDNSPSRLNLAKEAIQTIVLNYAKTLDIGLIDYKVNNQSTYTTWPYFMSKSGGFTFTSTASASTLPNPCYLQNNDNYCKEIKAVDGSNVLTKPFMVVSASSDDPMISDVLYNTRSKDAFITYGRVSPSNPYTYYTLADYNKGNVVSVSYSKATAGYYGFSTSPTNAGYVPYSDQVMYAQRGFGYYGSQVANTGHTAVEMTTTGLAPNAATISAMIAAFDPVLAPESSKTSTGEIKASATQSPIAGLMSYALDYYNGLPDFPSDPCATPSESVVLITDGLPTQDLSGKLWPPLGSLSAQGYGEYASFDSDGSLSSTNDVALTDSIKAITALKNAGIKVYIVGLGAGVSGVNPMAAKTLTAMAIAGGTTKFYTAQSLPELKSSLNQILTSSLTGAKVSAAPTVPGVVSAGSETFQTASDNTDGKKQGFLYAYKLGSNNFPALDTSWGLSGDAGGYMNATLRGMKLMTDVSGKFYLLTDTLNVPDSLFSASTPSAADIRAYTIDPSASNGHYLAGRASGSFLGTMTSQAAKPVLLNPSSNPYLLLNNSSYQAYAKSTANRAAAVIFSSDDGFLYSVSQSSGALNWGWMPSPSLPLLQNYGSFQGTQPMSGGFVVADSAVAGGWASFVVGTAQGGAIHYAVKLDANGKPDGVTLDNQAGFTAPQASAPTIWWDAQSGVGYALYATTNNKTSYLNVMNLSTGVVTQSKLSFTPSSNIAVDQSTAQMFMGDDQGNFYSAWLTAGMTASSVMANGNYVVGTAHNPGVAVGYIGYAQSGATRYVWTTSKSEVDVYKLDTTGWAWAWTSAIGSSASASAVAYATDPGTSGNGPQYLPAGSEITDLSVTAGGVLIVPVTTATNDSTNSCGTGNAKYYLYNLSDGSFPKGVFKDASGAVVVGNPIIGKGRAYSAVVANFNPLSQGGFAVYGSAQQDGYGKAAFSLVMTSQQGALSGVVGVRRTLMQQQ